MAVALVGCGGGGGGGGTTTTPTPVTYSVSWAARTRTDAPASALSVTFTLKDAQNQTMVTDVENRNAAPAAYTTSYTSTQTVRPGVYTATFTFHSAAGGGGNVVATGSQSVTIGANGTVPSIQTAGTVATVAIVPDQEVAVGATKDLTFSALDSEGSLLAVSPGSATWTITAGTAFLALAQGNSAVRGVAVGDATVRVTVDGVASDPVTVHVVGQGVPVTVTSQVPILFAAAQDGNGAWEAIDVSGTSATATISNAQGRYGLAAVIQTDSGPEMRVLQATTAEMTTFEIEGPATTLETAAVSGTVSNLDDGNTLLLNGFDSGDAAAANGDYSVLLGKRNPWDLLAILNDPNGMPVSATVRRGLQSAPISGVNFDIDADLQPMPAHTLGATGAPIDNVTLFAQLTTPNRTTTTLGIASENPTVYHSLAPALRNANDRYTLTANAFGDDWFDQSSIVLTTPVNSTLNLPTQLAPVTVTRDGIGEGTRSITAWSTLTGAKAYQITVFGSMIYDTTITAGWAGSTPNHSYQSVDFLDQPGWNTAWSLGEFSDWDMRAFSNNGTVHDLFDPSARLSNGYFWQTSERFGSLAELRRRNGAAKKRFEGLPGAPVLRKL